ncbi:hypothetical protein [Streptomyces fagopyri]|uniref:hypothetical protein n=1 Tax=Streptomyces fagopyri TaxID=2662397 RepID=UPI00382A7A0F
MNQTTTAAETTVFCTARLTDTIPTRDQLLAQLFERFGTRLQNAIRQELRRAPWETYKQSVRQ